MPRLGRTPSHQFIDRACRPGDHPERLGTWSEAERVWMDLAFTAAMTRAIESGAESCPTSPSTCYGTKSPRWGYQRPDDSN
jgi:hypothetical protein